jgi:hypothetical protein
MVLLFPDPLQNGGADRKKETALDRGTNRD